jgi:hypothetical protein
MLYVGSRQSAVGSRRSAVGGRQSAVGSRLHGGIVAVFAVDRTTGPPHDRRTRRGPVR